MVEKSIAFDCVVQYFEFCSDTCEQAVRKTSTKNNINILSRQSYIAIISLVFLSVNCECIALRK